MNDEEKQAIEQVLLSVIEAYSGYESLQKISKEYKDSKTILNLIEKQSKEIKELKEKNKILEAISLSFNEIQDRDKKWEDKIKEICQKKRNQIFSCTYVDEKQWKPFDRAIDAINDLEQSLLEKE